jgi:predicted nucleic acid-binding protein
VVVREDGSDAFAQLRPSITLLATARIAYVELRASLAAMRRDKRLTAAGLSRARQQLDHLWRSTSPIEIDSSLVTRAGDLAEEQALRGYDAVHLAALERLSSPAECLLACWDASLRRAASGLGYRLFPAALN